MIQVSVLINIIGIDKLIMYSNVFPHSKTNKQTKFIEKKYKKNYKQNLSCLHIVKKTIQMLLRLVSITLAFDKREYRH